MILIDSNVLFDLLSEDQRWYRWSAGAVAAAAAESELAINPVIYAEVSVRFSTPQEFDEIFPANEFRREPLPYAAAFIAGKAHLAYRRRGGIRSFTLPDFFIGAHAAVSGFRLLTRDAKRYSTYFPSVKLIAP